MALSLWDRFLIAVTPESTAEAAANDMMRTPAAQIYKPEEHGYDPHDFSSPNVYVQAKGVVTEGVKMLPRAAIILGVFLLVAVFIYAAAPAIVRR